MNDHHFAPFGDAPCIDAYCAERAYRFTDAPTVSQLASSVSHFACLRVLCKAFVADVEEFGCCEQLTEDEFRYTRTYSNAGSNYLHSELPEGLTQDLEEECHAALRCMHRAFRRRLVSARLMPDLEDMRIPDFHLGEIRLADILHLRCQVSAGNWIHLFLDTDVPKTERLEFKAAAVARLADSCLYGVSHPELRILNVTNGRFYPVFPRSPLNDLAISAERWPTRREDPFSAN